MSNFIVYAIFMSCFIISLVGNVTLKVKRSKVDKKYLQLLSDHIIVINKFNALNDSMDNQKIEATEGFIKFISDSRDWAYQYIEDVQVNLNKFISEVDPLITYFDEYGDAMGMLPNYEGMKKISLEFKELKKLLPDDYGKIDE